VSDSLRGFLVARPGQTLIAGDFASIEARVLAWSANEKHLVEMFAKGEDVYCYMAAQIYGRPITKKNKSERQLGKKAVLGCGYGMGKKRFRDACREDGILLSAEEAERIINVYRKTFRNIVYYWQDVERAAIDAVKHPGNVKYPGPNRKGLAFTVNGSFLWARLPSGRALCYPYPRVQQTEKWGSLRDELSYMSTDVGKWTRCSTYGGSLVENLTQAISRDLLVHSMANCKALGWPIVMHVHDEAVVEVPDGTVTPSELEAAMAQGPAWAAGLPIAVEAWSGTRYRK
jgi:DNA polymerase